MKVVIDIPDGRYEELMTDDIYLDVPIFREDIIATLPKNHGRLIDADDLEHITVCSKTRNSGITRIEAPTIIEADVPDTDVRKMTESEGEG